MKLLICLVIKSGDRFGHTCSFETFAKFVHHRKHLSRTTRTPLMKKMQRERVKA